MADDSKKPEDDKGNGTPIGKESLSGLYKRFTRSDSVQKISGQMDFFRAVRNNKTDEVRKFLDAGFDPNAYNANGLTPLHAAAAGNSVDTARLLIERGADPRRGGQHEAAYIPLEEAIRFGKSEVAEFLILHGGYVPGPTVSGWAMIHRACEKGDARIAGALLKAGANCNETSDNGSTPLLVAVSHGHADLVSLLLKLPAVIEEMDDHFVSTDEMKRTAFHLAVERGNLPVISAMIGIGADVNGKNAEGKTPLLCAIENCDFDTVRLLVESGADLNNTYGNYGTPLAYSCLANTLAGEGRARMVDFLIQLGADTDIPVPGSGMTPLHLASFLGLAEDVIDAFLRYPVNKEIRDSAGATPLIYAASSYHFILRKLLEAGADPDSRSMEDASTPLIHAVCHNNVNGVAVLLEAGANPALYDGHGKSGLSYAREAGRENIVKILESALKPKYPAMQKRLPPFNGGIQA